MNPQRTIDYRYRPTFESALLGTGFFLFCAVFAGYLAVDMGAGWILDGLIAPDLDGAGVFWWLIALVSLGFVAPGFASMRLALAKERCITLSSSDVAIPVRYSTSEKTVVPLRDIAGMTMQTVKSSRILTIVSGDAKTQVSERLFEDRASFEDFLTRLQFLLRAA
ncbi:MULTISPECIES: hypothetical protein [Ralstonia]|uniref:DUF304 domain-containing protein n=1 Tax=Ralstonia edaphi TaxID=3058599 RepID=A0AB72WX57_9RALS|nr:hypothetical protein [Ralstonia sp. LMG 6871]CAJ0736764.1 hypothetical protein R16034_00503 [Ralstonia sp. LMG 6871]